MPKSETPPLAIELKDIPSGPKHEHYPRDKIVAEAYWWQAINMIEAEQKEYKSFLIDECHVIKGSALGKLSNHRYFFLYSLLSLPFPLFTIIIVTSSGICYYHYPRWNAE